MNNRVEFIDNYAPSDVAVAAKSFAGHFHTQLVLVIPAKSTCGLPEITCVPDADVPLNTLAALLRKVADGMEKAHAAVGGLTLGQIDAAERGGQA